MIRTGPLCLRIEIRSSESIRHEPDAGIVYVGAVVKRCERKPAVSPGFLT